MDDARFSEAATVQGCFESCSVFLLTRCDKNPRRHAAKIELGGVASKGLFGSPSRY